jgi:hypothetical protein
MAYLVALVYMQIRYDSLQVRIQAKHGQEIDVNQEDVWSCHLTKSNISQEVHGIEVLNTFKIQSSQLSPKHALSIPMFSSSHVPTE